METRLNHDSDRVETLERQLKEARDLAAESDRKFEEVLVYFFFFTFFAITYRAQGKNWLFFFLPSFQTKYI